MAFDDVALLWLLGGMGGTLLYFAFFGGLPDKKDTVTYVYVALVMVWTLACALLLVLPHG